MTQKIIYIKSISAVEVSSAAEYIRVLSDGVVVRFNKDPQELPLVGLAKCVVSSSIENKSRIWSTVLNARLSDPFNFENKHFIFLLFSTDGHSYIVGRPSSPYPRVNATTTMPDRSSEPFAIDLTVEYSDIHGLTRVFLLS